MPYLVSSLRTMKSSSWYCGVDIHLAVPPGNQCDYIDRPHQHILPLTKFWLLPRENINFDLEEIIERLPDLSNYSQKHIDKILLQANTEVGFSAGKPTLHTQKPPPHEAPVGTKNWL